MSKKTFDVYEGTEMFRLISKKSGNEITRCLINKIIIRTIPAFWMYNPRLLAHSAYTTEN